MLERFYYFLPHIQVSSSRNVSLKRHLHRLSLNGPKVYQAVAIFCFKCLIWIPLDRVWGISGISGPGNLKARSVLKYSQGQFLCFDDGAGTLGEKDIASPRS